VDIAIKNLQKTIAVDSGILRAIKKVIRKTCELESRKLRRGRITVCLVDNKQMRKFNLQYLRQARPTDVLAFDLGSGVADIIVSTETAISNARTFKTSALYEILLYVAHGLLHVLGYDDKTLRQRKVIDNKAERILKFCHAHP
jgi:probable rRNA maturation factor